MRWSVNHLIHFCAALALSLMPLLFAAPAAAESPVTPAPVVSAPVAPSTTAPAAKAVSGAVSGTVCPKCGRIHSASTAAVATVSYEQPASSGGAQNVLSILNGQRSRQGLRSLRYDGALQAVAERRVRQMASMGIKSHPPGSFSPGRYEGVGWSSSFSPSGVHACYTSDPNMSVAGAAMIHGRDGVYFAVVYR